MTIFTKPPKTNVIYTEPQWIAFSLGATPKSILGVTPKDIAGLTPKSFNEKYGTVGTPRKVNSPTFTKPAKTTTIFTEPLKE